MQFMDDLEFVQKCTKGDKLAWDEFVERYSRLIYSYIHSVLKIRSQNSHSSETVDDLFQEIFVLLTKDNFSKLKTFKAKNGCSLSSWLRQVTTNFTIDYLRCLKPTVSLEEGAEENLILKDIVPDNSDIPSQAAIEEERLFHLSDCIQKLDDDDRFFLELFINKGLSLEQLKRALRISRGAVDMRRARIVERLKHCFKSKGFALDF
ncbi:MAG: sigma-70 family RNA polymerase sigma factor [Candidatus Omnitrophica bacterium]|nr:sigma-70 family RNA polymerase sigma factor [Candidatus Omnitrophota bacterium]